MSAPASTGLREGDRIEVEVTSVAVGGDAFGRWTPPGGAGQESGGLAVFADRGIPGDRVEGRVVSARPRHVRIEVDAIARESDRAIPAACEVADVCGGCRFWRAAYTDELAWKSDATVESVARIARSVSWPAARVVPSSSPVGYRGRARLRFDASGGLGFYRAGSNEAVAAARCAILHPLVEAVRPQAAALFAGVVGVESVFLELDELRHGVAVTAELDRRDAPEVFRLVRARAARLGTLTDITTIVIASGRRTSAVVGDGRVHRARTCGDRDVVVRDPVRAFSQANVSMNPVLVAMVVEALRGSTGPVLELYAGSGNLTFPIVGAGFEVDAVESARPAVDAAAAAWRADAANGPGLRLHVVDLDVGLPDPVRQRVRQYGTVVTDPPRGGMSPALVRDLAALTAARRIVYVSCDPPAMARDAERLAASGWAPTRLSLLDMYPRTPHIEAVAAFERNH